MNTGFDLLSPITTSFLNKIPKDKLPKAICRYTKNLTLQEAKIISAYGIDLVSVFEAQGNLYGSFTAAFGVHDSNRVLEQIAKFNQPKGSALYFCGCDFDASNAQIKGGIKDYFTSLNPIIIKAGFEVGVYGNGSVCQFMLDNKLATKTWLWGVNYSNGTQDFLKSNKWNIHQHVTTNLYGVSIDPDDLNDNYGGWRLAA